MIRSFIPAIAVALAAISPAHAVQYVTSLAGANEVPPVATSATGSAKVTTLSNILRVRVSFSGLTDSAVFGHIHCCANVGNNAGVAIEFPSLPQAVTGSYFRDFNLLSSTVYSAGFLAANGGSAFAARNALIVGLNAGRAYVNIHNAVYRGGEIRGQLAVPAPATLALFGLGLVALVGARRFSA